ncbi:MAG: MmgE/PrpD family protein [Chloroflexi bacterium]|nr:MmgE/PrpD family protein [Chloroflexota bacterium]
MQNLTRTLVQHIITKNHDSLPEKVIHIAKRHTLDTLGCMVIGQVSAPGRIAVSLAKEMGEKPMATIVGERQMSSPLLAAMANGTAAHSWELDDRHLPSGTHTSSAIVSATLAAGEKASCSGRDFLCAVVLGQDMAARIGLSGRYSHRAMGWHSTGTVTTFGCAAAAGKLIGLDEERLLQAFGLAGTQAAAMYLAAFHNHAKPFHPGKAAMNGLLAAFLAEKGFTGGRTALEGDPIPDSYSRGYLAQSSSGPEPEKILKDLGNTYEFERSALKAYSCAGDMHNGIEALLTLKRMHNIKPEEITAINVKGFEHLPIHFSVPNPTTSTEALLSYEHCLAVALLHEEVIPQYFMPDRLGEAKYREVRAKVTLAADPKFGQGTMHKGASVSIVTPRGTFTETVLSVKGEKDNPMSDAEVIKKFTSLATSVFKRTRAETIADTVFNLEKVSEIGELAELLRP